MKLTEFSVAHPVSIVMLIVILVMLGAISIVGLPIAMFPELEFPVITVSTDYDGVAPQEIEERVTRPIEQAVAAVEDVKRLRSVASEGKSTTVIQFHWGADTEMLRIDVREKLDAIRGGLPDDIDDPIISRMTFGTDPQAIRVAISSPAIPLTELRRMADDIFKPRFESIDGVATVNVGGGYEREIQINVIPEQLSSYALTLSDLMRAIGAENLNNPGGRIQRGREEFLVRTIGKFDSLAALENLALANRGGAIVTLSDVAEVVDAHKDITSLSRVNGLETVELAVLKEANGNSLAISDAARAQVAELGREFSQISFDVAFDSAPFIRDAVVNVQDNAAWGAFFAVLVLWPFLSRRRWGVLVAIAASGAGLLLIGPLSERYAGAIGADAVALGAVLGLPLFVILVRLLWRSSPATLIVSLAMPISITATFILIKFADLTLNVVSLGGLALGIGMLVDNSVVVIENIARHLSFGKRPKRAAVDGASEVALAILVSTLTTLAVFLPIAWIEGIAREVFTDLSLTVTFSLSTSLLVSITIVPMLASKFLQAEEGAPQEHEVSIEEEIATLHRPQAGLREVLLHLLERRRRISGILVGATVIFAASVVGLMLHPKDYFPKDDEDTFAIYVKMPKGTAFPVLDDVTRRVEQIVRRDPDVETTFASVRRERTTVGVTLLKDRTRHSSDIQTDLRRALGDIPDAEIGILSYAGAGDGGRDVEVHVLGEDLDRLATLSTALRGHMENIPGALDVRSSLEQGRPELRVEIDRLKAADVGLSVREVSEAVETAMDGQVAGQYTDAGDEVDIRVQYKPSERRNIANLSDLVIRNPEGVPFALKNVARVEVGTGPIEMRRIDQRRMVTVDAERDRHVALSRIAAQITEGMADVPMPVGYSWEFAGTEERRTEAFDGLALSLAIAIVLIYMTMAALFESLTQPFVIMLTLPLSLAGVYGGLALFGQDLSVPAFVGIIMLMGIVVNNAIVLLDYANRLRRRGLVRREAIALASAVRMRPILMTAGTTVLGMMPMALGVGRGSIVFQSLAAGVVGGIAASTILTLVVVPCAYDGIDRIAAYFRQRMRAIGINVEDPFEIAVPRGPAHGEAPAPLGPTLVSSPEVPERAARAGHRNAKPGEARLPAHRR
ncbi:MAG: efflux RND transporter permease subunit [Deltaproteobacteria bacterium]|nr:MAG: efflux RND transporter permease subunit [Deltaproteobacteria bacterium]